MQKQALILPALFAGLTQLGAQEFIPDAARTATGWARSDVAGGCAFHDAARKVLAIWSKDGSSNAELPLGALEQAPEKWVIDQSGGAWIVGGATLVHLDRKGKVLDTTNLPGAVSDLTWDARALYLVYRDTGLYIEKRDLKKGNVIWSHGNKPRRETVTRSSLHRLAVADDGNLLVVSGSSMGIQVFDGIKGKPTNLIQPKFGNQAAPPLNLGDQDRGPVGFWYGKNVLWSAALAPQLAVPGVTGITLIRMDLATGDAKVLNLGLKENHGFVGVFDGEAIFTQPEGGLVFVPIQ